MKGPKVAIAVHGRLHAFHLCRELERLGVDTTLLTNYPIREVEKFGIDGSRVFSYVPHGVGSRVLNRLSPNSEEFERFTHVWFGRWAAAAIAADRWDALYIFSGVAEETLDALEGRKTVRVLARGSSHVVTQARILEEEEARAGRFVERPTPWRIRRETSEYRKADAIVTLSSFAHQSFLAEGVPAEKVWLLPSGVEVARFQASALQIQARMDRLRRGEPLRVLTAGTLSFRKGLLDHLDVVRLLSPGMKFRFVGTIDSTVVDLVKRAENLELRPRVHEHDLPAEYEWADVFLFPSLEEGFPAVLAQARASGLPLLATPNSSAPELIQEGRTGCIVPIRDTGQIASRLRSWDLDRELLCSMVQNLATLPKLRGWPDMATEFLGHVEALREARGW